MLKYAFLRLYMTALVMNSLTVTVPTIYDVKSKLQPSAVSVNNPSLEMRFEDTSFCVISSVFALQVLGTQIILMIFDYYVTFFGIIC